MCERNLLSFLLQEIPSSFIYIALFFNLLFSFLFIKMTLYYDASCNSTCK